VELWQKPLDWVACAFVWLGAGMFANEQQIEQALISKLVDLKYRLRDDIKDRATLEANFREKFEALNRVRLSDSEFARLLESIHSADVYQAAQTLRHMNSFERDDGSSLNYMLVNLRDWCKNDFEVVSQLRMNTRNSHQRYDVIVLINGIPVVQIELKKHDISPRRAIEQIVKYKKEVGNGYGHSLLCFMQLFIVSNQSNTWYFTNNNEKHFSFNADERFLPIYQWATEDNKKVNHLDSFADKFLAKCTLGEMISRYMVLLASEQKLLMMRPYQIYAVKAIVDCIAHNCGNGYIWHTTGSGKTLTSFKAATLLKDNPSIEKCLFVVDRKDLDKQTREEFNSFQEGCVEENTNTETLVQRLLSDNYADKVIVTTIQKLGLALDSNHRRNYQERLKALRDKRLVFIFDECHRSQFGENHQAIREFFPKAQLFGFTGTPIFDENASSKLFEEKEGRFKTTDDLFQRQLHAYTITHAIEDKTVLKFNIDYYKIEDHVQHKVGEELKKSKIVESILAKHAIATNQRKFNALLACASINDAIEYFDLLQSTQAEKQAEDADFIPLNIACVFSPPAEGNKDIKQIQQDLPQEEQDNQQEPSVKKAALSRIIQDYNARYGTDCRISEFDRYYQDVQKRIKDQQYPNSDVPHSQKIDICIVVDMLLTGFDSKYLGTLYVDKNLKYHGLIQAFSRTNRTLNDSKPHGHILDFRGQQKAVEQAISLFSGESIEKSRKIWLVEAAPKVIEQLQGAMTKLRLMMQTAGCDCTPEEVCNIRGNDAKREFINCFKQVQKLKTQLDQYTDLNEEQKNQINQLIEPQQLQGFRSAYLETAHQFKTKPKNKTGENNHNESGDNDELPDFELVLFASAIIDYDYIMNLLARMTQQPPEKMQLQREELIALLKADAKFIDDEAIAEYINSLPTNQPLTEKTIRADYAQFKQQKKNLVLAELAQRYGLESAALQAFVDKTLRRRIFDSEQLGELLKPLGLHWKVSGEKEVTLAKALAPLLHQYANGHNISGLDVYEQ